MCAPPCALQEAFLCFQQPHEREEIQTCLDLLGVTTGDQVLDNIVNTQQSLLPQNCRTTFRALVEEHEKTPALFPIKESYLPLSTGLKYTWLSETKPEPTKYDRMATTALSRRGAPRTRAPLLPVFPLVLALARRVEFLSF